MIVNRKILTENFTCVSPQFKKYPKMNREEFCNYIDGWKAYLVNECGLYQGSIVVNAMVLGDPDHFAFFFACAELGIKHLAPNYPYMDEFMDISVINRVKPDAIFNDAISKNYYHQNKVLKIVDDMMAKWGGKTYWQDEIDIFSYNKPQTKSDPVIMPYDVLQLYYTTGRVGDNAKIVPLSHGYALDLAERNISAFNLAEQDVAIHTNNLHHALSLTTYFLPSLMCVDEHRFYNIPNNTEYWPLDMVGCLREDFSTPKRKKILVQSNHVMNALKKTFDFENTEFIQHRVDEYSEVDAALNVFVKGRLPDDFYDVTVLKDGTTLVDCVWFDHPQLLDGKFSVVDGHYKKIGRRSKSELSLIVELATTSLKHFEIVERDGRKFLIVFSREPISPNIETIFDQDFDGIYTIHPNAFASDDDRQWWALKEMCSRSLDNGTPWEYWEERRIKGTDSLDNLVEM